MGHAAYPIKFTIQNYLCFFLAHDCFPQNMLLYAFTENTG
jgi:hypothetical protein